MYKVFICGIELYRSHSIEDAVAFALGLHRSSNVEHSIDVYDPLKDQSTLTFQLKAEKSESHV